MLGVPLLSIMVNVSVALAVPLSENDTERAESLGEAGVMAYDLGDLQQAKTKLEEGYRLSGWGTIGVWLAKTYEKLGLTSDAYRVYVEVASSLPVADEAEPFVQARAEAKRRAEALAAASGLIEVKSHAPKPALSISVDGKVTALTPYNTFAVPPGRHVVDVTWQKGRLPRQTLTLAAGETHVIDLDAVKVRRSAVPEPVTQYLNFKLSSEVERGWSLVDSSGNVLCELPCKWSGIDPETLVVKRGEEVLPVKLGRKLERRETMDVSVNPKRGSKGWALGVGIPSGVFLGASLVGLANSNYRTQTAFIVSTSVFGAGFAASAWWFWWSKSRPYLDYDVPAAPAAPQKASLQVDWLGSGIGLSGTF